MNPIKKSIRLVTFDAFGTLYTPKEPIGSQYVNVARRHGLDGVQNYNYAADVEERFREAFKTESMKRPNYGKSVGMNASEWWANVIRSTLVPVLKPSTLLPEGLIPDLVNHFSSSRGYRLYPDVLPFFQELRKARSNYQPNLHDPLFSSLTVGIISNSDDRVSSILSSLGLRVGPRRYGTSTESWNPDGQGGDGDDDDIDFVALSYDVGVEKPDRKIFDAARQLGAIGGSDLEPGECLHVGDDFVKDVRAAEGAGWKGLKVDRPTEKENRSSGHGVGDLIELMSILRMDGKSSTNHLQQ